MSGSVVRHFMFPDIVLVSAKIQGIVYSEVGYLVEATQYCCMGFRVFARDFPSTKSKPVIDSIRVVRPLDTTLCDKDI